MAETKYIIKDVDPALKLETEEMGSKVKFWYCENEKKWLFKYPHNNTGEHWAEKIAYEIGNSINIDCARVELATCNGDRGSISENFVADCHDLFHGNQLLYGNVDEYDKDLQKQKDHTLENIMLSIDSTFVNQAGRRKAKVCIAEYLVLDALIGNTDRHHENWGILTRCDGRRKFGEMAPSFDHACSLGRELRDEGRKSRQKYLELDRVGQYSKRARGAIYWNNTDNHALSPLEVVRKGCLKWPESFQEALQFLVSIDAEDLTPYVNKVPTDWMSDTAKRFASALISYNLSELKGLII